SPSDLLDRIALDPASERLRHELAAQAVPEHRDVRLHGGIDERQHARDPREVVVHAHGPAHEYEPGIWRRVRRYGLADVDLDDAPRYAVLVEVCGKIPWPFGACVTEDGDCLHGKWQ